MKKYNVPATEVVALAGMGMLMASDPTQLNPDPNNQQQTIEPGNG